MFKCSRDIDHLADSRPCLVKIHTWVTHLRQNDLNYNSSIRCVYKNHLNRPTALNLRNNLWQFNWKYIKIITCIDAYFSSKPSTLKFKQPKLENLFCHNVSKNFNLKYCIINANFWSQISHRISIFIHLKPRFNFKHAKIFFTWSVRIIQYHGVVEVQWLTRTW